MYAQHKWKVTYKYYSPYTSQFSEDDDGADQFDAMPNQYMIGLPDISTEARYPTSQEIIDAIRTVTQDPYASAYKVTKYDPNASYSSILLEYGNTTYYITYKAKL